MTEALVVFGVVVVLVLLGTLAVVLPVEALAVIGGACVIAGFVVGLPSGAYYHYVLYRCLATRGNVPPGFIWQPTRFHGLLRPDELRRVMPWFYAGALSFGLIMLGSVLLMLGFLRV